MNLELMGALNELEKERGISREVLLKAIEDAIQSAFRRSAQAHQNLRIDFEEKTGRVRVFARKAVVERVADPANEISLEQAQRINPRYEVDDVVEVELTLPELGRIAAQTAKQVVVQRIREAERNRIYDEYVSREGDILTGIVRRLEHRMVYVDLGRAEAVLPPQEQVPAERYAPGMRMKFYLAEVRKTSKGPQLILSRSHPGLVKRLFELEVPEIHDGVVEIRAWAREPGHRSKIAVWSTHRNVDPVGACVGPRGARVQQVVKELRQEKVDVIAWDPDPEIFIANALQPARVLKVFLDPTDHSARVVVPEMQLSLAIGKEGQNARLAARLTGWRIDIKSEAQWAEVQQEFEEKRRQWLETAVPAASAAPADAPEVTPDGRVTTAEAAPGQAVPTEALPAVVAPRDGNERVADGASVVAPEAQDDAGTVLPEEQTPAEEAMPEEIPVPIAEKPEDEEEKGRGPKGKGAGKVRRLKSVHRDVRRHLEEELEEVESLPSLFTGEAEPAGPEAEVTQPAAAPAAEAPEEEKATAAKAVGSAEEAPAPVAIRRGASLSVPVFAVLRQRPAGLEPKTPEASADPAPAPSPPAAERAQPVQAKPRQKAAPPREPQRPQQQEQQPPASQREPERPQQPQRPPAAELPRGAERRPERPQEQVPPRQDGQGALRLANGGSAEADEKPGSRKGKVLKSLSDLSLEDFGFTPPAGRPRRGRK